MSSQAKPGNGKKPVNKEKRLPKRHSCAAPKEIELIQVASMLFGQISQEPIEQEMQMREALKLWFTASSIVQDGRENGAQASISPVERQERTLRERAVETDKETFGEEISEAKQDSDFLEGSEEEVNDWFTGDSSCETDECQSLAYNDAVKKITGEPQLKRAKDRFEKYLRSNIAAKTAEALIKKYRKNGIGRGRLANARSRFAAWNDKARRDVKMANLAGGKKM